MTNDPVADMLVRLQNAGKVGNVIVQMPYSTLKEAIARSLRDLGYLTAVETTPGVPKILILTLTQVNKAPLFTKLVRLSTPGHRRYIKAKELPLLRRKWRNVILSTPSGVLESDEAQKKRLGGELLVGVA